MPYLGRCAVLLVARLVSGQIRVPATWKQLDSPRTWPSFSVVCSKSGGTLQEAPQRRHVVVGVEVVCVSSTWVTMIGRVPRRDKRLETHVASNEFAYTIETSLAKE